MYITTNQTMILLASISIIYQVMLTRVSWHSTSHKIGFSAVGGFIAWLGVFFPVMYFFFNLPIR